MPPRNRPAAPIERVRAAAYRIPTDGLESDGTLAWDSTTLVTVEVEAGGRTGFGYTYAAAAAAQIAAGPLFEVIQGREALDVPGAWLAMVSQLRNAGRPGVAATALSAVDAALWDLKGKLLGLSLSALLGAVREGVPAYGSGGFTSYDPGRLREQLSGWAAEGFGMVKMKVGRDPVADPDRVTTARRAIGPAVRLFVDANGAYTAKQALALAEHFAEQGVTWLEEPVTADDLPGLRLVRLHCPAGMEVAAGEYGYDLFYFERMVAAGAVDVLQADATRCLGPTGFLQAAALAFAHHLPLSSHCAPSLHAALLCAAPTAVHAEYFYDHARIESAYFEGIPFPKDGQLPREGAGPGLGFVPKRADLARFAI
ncbi:MAG TPA: enolase C-terminal domain-like protein [Anaeromyxobacter sp.]|nr:enolase C-terminal domain-like protein [Anaeromyxobacter sp.]